MRRKVISMTPEERLNIIYIYVNITDVVKEIKQKTGYSETAIRETIKDYRNGLIDAKGLKKNISISVKEGRIVEITNPIEFI